MENEQGVTSDPSTDTGSTPAPVVEEVVEAPQPQKPPKGFVPYQALEEERTKRKELEEQLANASTPSEDSEEVFSDEGKTLRNEIKALNDRIRSNERKEARREVESTFPILRERRDDFDTFLEDEENKRLSIKKAAKLFLAENNLLNQEPPERKGIEKPAGGGQTPSASGLSDETLEELRVSNYRQYEKLLRTGKIPVKKVAESK